MDKNKRYQLLPPKMIPVRAGLALLAAGLALVTGPAAAQSQQDVSFVVLGKTTNHRQMPDGSHNLLNYHIFAEIFLKENGSVSGAVLRTPHDGGAEMPFEGEGGVLEVHGGRYATESELDQAFPDGKYTFVYTLSDGRRFEQAVDIASPGGQSRIPPPIKISLFQDGLAADPGAIDPNRDVDVRWSEFQSGNDDPNGIVDDLIFVITGNCQGKRINHSGGPFGDTPYLTHADSSYRVPADVLSPGESYQLSVEQADMETGVYRDVPQIATWAETTFIEFSTVGERLPERDACPDPMYDMDKGQTDRPQKP
jgi:hypothetical protein